MVKSKRGISAIVAVVLIILISVAGIGILWVSVFPMFKDNLDMESSEVKVSIDTTGGYTFYDSSEKKLYVQVKRGPDESIIDGLKVVITILGNSIVKEYDSSVVPEPNSKRLIVVDDIEEKPDSVSVIPLIKKTELSSAEEGFAIKVSNINSGSSANSIPSTPTACVNEEDICSIGVCKGGVCSPIEVSSCMELNQEGATYVLTEDIFTSSNCFNITGNDITFDGAGYSILGDNTDIDYGIYSKETSGLSIINFNNISNFGSNIIPKRGGAGIYLDNVNSSIVNNLSLVKNYIGLNLYDFGYYNIVEDVQINESLKMGISASSYQGTFKNLVFGQNDIGASFSGILESDFDNLLFLENRLALSLNNDYFNNPVIVNNNYFRNIRIFDSIEQGMYIDRMFGNSFEGLYSSDNFKNGVIVTTSANNTFKNLEFMDNGDDGITLAGSSNNSFSNVVSKNNLDNGLRLRDNSNYNEISFSDICNNNYDINCSLSTINDLGDNNCLSNSCGITCGSCS